MSSSLDFRDTARAAEIPAPAGEALQPWMSAVLSLRLAAVIQEQIEKSIEEFDKELQWRLLRIGNRE